MSDRERAREIVIDWYGASRTFDGVIDVVAGSLIDAIATALAQARAEALRRAAGVAQGHKAADPDEWDSADWDQCCDRIATAILALIKEPGHE